MSQPWNEFLHFSKICLEKRVSDFLSRRMYPTDGLPRTAPSTTKMVLRLPFLNAALSMQKASCDAPNFTIWLAVG